MKEGGKKEGGTEGRTKRGRKGRSEQIRGGGRGTEKVRGGREEEWGGSRARAEDWEGGGSQEPRALGRPSRGSFRSPGRGPPPVHRPPGPRLGSPHSQQPHAKVKASRGRACRRAGNSRPNHPESDRTRHGAGAPHHHHRRPLLPRGAPSEVAAFGRVRPPAPPPPRPTPPWQPQPRTAADQTAGQGRGGRGGQWSWPTRRAHTLRRARPLRVPRGPPGWARQRSGWLAAHRSHDKDTGDVGGWCVARKLVPPTTCGRMSGCNVSN